MTPSEIATIRTAFADDPEAQVYALAARLAREAGEVVAWNGITAASYCAQAARLLFPHSPAQLADSAGERGAAGDDVDQPHNGGDNL